MSRFHLVLIGFVCAFFALAGACANAAFPGANGRIVTTSCEDGPSCTQWHIWTMNPDGSGQAQLFATAGFLDDDSSYSADGRWVVFQRCVKVGSNFNCGIGIADAHGQNVTSLTPSDGTNYDDYPSFSPDGAQIVFRRDLAGSGDIWVMGANGSAPHPLTSGAGNDSTPVFSPDGSKIVFTRSGKLMVMSSGGGTPAAIPGSTGCELSPDFSPDGGRLVYKDCSVSPARIALTNLDGSGRHFVTSASSGGDDDEPAFSPDGSMIVYEAHSPGPGAAFPLFTVDLSGSGTPHPITTASDYKSSWGRVPSPSVDSPPTIVGGPSPRVGHALSATAGAANWGGTTSFQWFRCGTTCGQIAAATATTYKPTNADKGKTLTVRQTQSDAGGSASGDSAATAKVAGEPGAKIAHTGTVRHGTALIALRCPKAESGFCKGKLTLSGTIATSAMKLGAGSFRMRAGKRAKVKVKLTKRARAAVARGHNLKVKATAKTRDNAGNLTTTRAKITLKR